MVRPQPLGNVAIQSRLKSFLNKKLLEQNNGNYLPEDLISAILDPRLKSFEFCGMMALKERAILTVKTELRKYTREPISETVAVRKSTMLLVYSQA
jgi:hypothetical protein